jgi:protein-S-isoprenylcysteine O-methyltransferase Ste14
LSFIPAFELGLWNAWILVVPMLIIFFFDVRVTAARESGKAGDFQLTRKENIIMNAVFIPMVVSFVYAVFLPLQLGTTWLYAGLLIYLFGIVFTIAAILNFATSPKDKVITKGLYRFTRNPTYIGMILMQIGLGIACSSWLYLLLTVVLMIILNAVSPSEERYCLYRYGDDYRKYKNSTPRWIGIPKSRNLNSKHA